MAHFAELVKSPPGSKFVLQGNAAFALGVVHAGYHAATGYAGTPSTEVIDKCLAYVQETMKVGWSVNEAVAVSTALGHALAGSDVVVTMKIPGIFQAADAISTTAFFTGKCGALVIYAATDYVPSSTQHVIDARYFLASAGLPILEPRNHQELYDIAAIAADMSREFRTPVVVLVSGMLAHSESLIETKPSRTAPLLELPENLKEWMLLPGLARANYNKVIRERIPALRSWSDSGTLVTESRGTDDWGVIVNGANEIIVREALLLADSHPSILSLGMAFPLPETRIKDFAARVKGKMFMFEEGYRFIEEKIRLMGIELISKDEDDAITDWTPDQVLQLLSRHVDVFYKPASHAVAMTPVPRPPSLCPGCLYKPFALAVAKLKKRKKIYASFGDIGCSTLLYFFDALDTVSCMGASDSIRQGFVISRPDMAGKVISVIGDSTECHSGMDSTRNAVFRNVPGVKVILDNYTTAMTGGQPAPSSATNLAGQQHKFKLEDAIRAEGGRTVVVDAFDAKAVEKELKDALKLVDQNVFTTIILQGECIHQVAPRELKRTVEIDAGKCKECDLCNMCPGIEMDSEGIPHFTDLCTNCGTGEQVCMQRCPFDAIVYTKVDTSIRPALPTRATSTAVEFKPIGKENLPASLRVAIRGIGGQGNLFFGRVLTEMALRTPYADTRIVKGETHGMAQLGGPVISTFSCGDVYSPVLTPGSADVLVVMEESEVLRPGFLELLKPNGTVIINNYAALPVLMKKEDYPLAEDIERSLGNYNIVKIDANKLAIEIGDTSLRSANVIVIGLLSTIQPFNAIPEAIWQAAIQAASPNENAGAANQLAFERGRVCATIQE